MHSYHIKAFCSLLHLLPNHLQHRQRPPAAAARVHSFLNQILHTPEHPTTYQEEEPLGRRRPWRCTFTLGSHEASYRRGAMPTRHTACSGGLCACR